MSETAEGDAPLAQSEAQWEPLIPLRAFAETLRPRAAQRYPNGRVAKFDPGHPDEIWLKLLSIRHGAERHTRAEWFAIIDGHRNQPAHPADPRYVRQ